MKTVVTWNVAGRVRTVGLQAEALAQQPADVVALQEVRLSSLAPWRDALAGLGFRHVITSLDAQMNQLELAKNYYLLRVAGGGTDGPPALPLSIVQIAVSEKKV